MELILKEDLPKKLLLVLQAGKKKTTKIISKISFEQKEDNVVFVIIQFSIERDIAYSRPC